ncbi:hypothetical protein NUACC21_38210 [Scytonema sp. NUACC21]
MRGAKSMFANKQQFGDGCSLLSSPLLLDIFNSLRQRHGLLLGVEEYLMVLRSVQAGFGISNHQELEQLCCMLLMMPGMDGYEVTIAIRQNTALPFIPILLISAHDSPNVAKGLDLGANDFIRKPVTVDELLARVRSLLRLATMLRKTAVESTEASTAQSSLETPQQIIMKAQVSSEQASLHTQQFAMNSLVLDLQRDAFDPSVSVLNLLRKALVVSQKLALKEFQEWIDFELNGYSN